jgi:hypothetical protein
MSARIEVGDVYNCKMTFKIASTGAYADPTTVTVEIKAPTAIKVTYVYGAVGSPVVKSSTGIYYVPLAFTEAGPWSVIWTGSGTGAVEGSESGAVVVNQRPFV